MALDLEEFENLYTGGMVRCVGDTYFFRSRELIERLVNYIELKPPGSVSNILFAPCSVGCEPLSFSMVAEKRGVFSIHPDLKIHALDISENFLKIAREGSYPSRRSIKAQPSLDFVSHVPEEFKAYISIREPDRKMVDISDTIRSRVNFLPAQDILQYRPNDLYDATVCLNLFMHLREDGKRVEMFNHLVAITSGVICVNNTECIEKKHIVGLMEGAGRTFSRLSHNFTNSTKIDADSSGADFDGFLEGRTGVDALVFTVS